MKAKKRIDKVRVLVLVDENPDTSFIGEYTDEPSDWAIVRSEGEYLSNLPEDFELPRRGWEYRFFVPYAGGEKEGTEDFQKYGKRDFDRMEAAGRGDWFMVGVMAEATVAVQLNGNNYRTRAVTADGNWNRLWKLDRLTSGGLWGIESDSGHDYLDNEGKEQLADLRDILLAYGFTAEQIDAAFADVGEMVWK